MTKCNSSERSDELGEMRVVTVVVRVGNASRLKVRKPLRATCSFIIHGESCFRQGQSHENVSFVCGKASKYFMLCFDFFSYHNAPCQFNLCT